MQILLVDDDPAMLTVLSRVLRADGHDVDCCQRSRDALEQLRARPYALLLTDLTMPDMGGLELVREARVLCTDLRCIIISGYVAPPEAERGETTWLEKPLDIDALLAVLGDPSSTA